ncbi:MAG: hypothetical protein RBT49_11345 [Bacteroidales bacterium]|jgi:hypothetical protein|nr:hypothetical protein [Bacteroidales bacterium]
MKKFLLVLAAVTLISLPIVMTSCDEDNPVSCSAMIMDITEASLDYLSDQSTTNCNNYKNALKDYLDSDCELAGTSYQTSYDNLTCN